MNVKVEANSGLRCRGGKELYTRRRLHCTTAVSPAQVPSETVTRASRWATMQHDACICGVFGGIVLYSLACCSGDVELPFADGRQRATRRCFRGTGGSSDLETVEKVEKGGKMQKSEKIRCEAGPQTRNRNWAHHPMAHFHYPQETRPFAAVLLFRRLSLLQTCTQLGRNITWPNHWPRCLQLPGALPTDVIVLVWTLVCVCVYNCTRCS